MAENANNSKEAEALLTKIVNSLNSGEKRAFRIPVKAALLFVVYFFIIFGNSVRQLVGGRFDFQYMGTPEYWSSVFSDTATNLIVLFVMFVYMLDTRKRKHTRYNEDKAQLEQEVHDELHSASFNDCMEELNVKRLDKGRRPIANSFVTNGYNPKQKEFETYDPYAVESNVAKFGKDIGPRVIITLIVTIGFRAIVLDLVEATDWKTALVGIIFTLIPLVSNAYIGHAYSLQWLEEKTLVDLRKRLDIWSFYKTYKQTWKVKEETDPCQMNLKINTTYPLTTTVNLSESILDTPTRQLDNSVKPL